MFYSDYHVHTAYSPDSKSDMENMIKKAVKMGIKELALTDHMDFAPDLNPTTACSTDYAEYVMRFNSLRDLYRKEIRLILGVEVGLGRHLADTVEQFVSAYPFEFVIGSSHDTSKIDISFSIFYEGKTKDEAFYEYFNEILDNICLIPNFDVYGHLDYIVRYSNYQDNSLNYSDYAGIIDKILKELVRRGKGLEVNTSGYRYGLNRTHPQFDIIKRYRELGGEILTLGSDAHRPEHIAERFGDALDMIRSAGFKRLTVYRNRKPEFVGI